jgi:hypothetical protein
MLFLGACCKNSFQRVKIIILLCLIASVALPSVSHAFDTKSEAHCEKPSSSEDRVSTKSIDSQEKSDHTSDGCDCCHSGCCNLKTLSKLPSMPHHLSHETVDFGDVSQLLKGTSGTDLFRPPKSLV